MKKPPILGGLFVSYFGQTIHLPEAPGKQQEEKTE